MKKKRFTIGTINYTPIGYELGYCLGEHEETHEKHIYYFNGYPDLKYKKCEVILVKEADIATFGGDAQMGTGEDKNHKYYKGKIVRKGIGKILSQDWQCLPGKGIQCDEVIIHFGMKRTEVRTLLSNEQESIIPGIRQTAIMNFKIRPPGSIFLMMIPIL